MVGVGLARISNDLDAKDDDWKGGISDSHRGILLFSSSYIWTTDPRLKERFDW